MGNNIVSNSVIRRLPRYYRFLGDLKASGMSRISSRELSERMGLTASQIRQDLNCFGGFGQQGYGYHIEILQAEIGRILGIDSPKSAILIGAGNLGRAMAQHIDFEKRGFHLVGVFDKKEALVGQVIRGLPIRDITTLDEFCRESLPVIRECGFLMTLTCGEQMNYITREPDCLYGIGRYNRSGLYSTDEYMAKLFNA